MRVMTARVHHAWSSRSVRNIAFFLDRQGIDICSHRDHRRPGSGDSTISVMMPRFPVANPMRNPGGGKLFAQIFRRREFFAAELGMLMEVTPEP